jgi:hypothetical protein
MPPGRGLSAGGGRAGAAKVNKTNAALRPAPPAQATADPRQIPREPMSDAVRLVIDRAPVMPPAIPPWVAPEPEPVRLRTDVIVLLGIGPSTSGEGVERYGIGEALCVYRDSFRRRRVLRPEQHDRMTLRSLFINYEKTLAQLWPKPNPRAGFDHNRAAEELIADLGRGRKLLAQKGRAALRRSRQPRISADRGDALRFADHAAVRRSVFDAHPVAELGYRRPGSVRNRHHRHRQPTCRPPAAAAKEISSWLKTMTAPPAISSNLPSRENARRSAARCRSRAAKST